MITIATIATLRYPVNTSRKNLLIGAMKRTGMLAPLAAIKTIEFYFMGGRIMSEPKVYVSDRSKASRLKMVSQVSNDLAERALTSGETTEELVSMSIIATLLNAFQGHQDVDLMIENVEDFIAAYTLIRCRTQNMASNN